MPVEIVDSSGELVVGLQNLHDHINEGRVSLKLFDSEGDFSYPFLPLKVEDEGKTVRVVIPFGSRVFMWSMNKEFIKTFPENEAWITSTEDGGFVEQDTFERQVLEMDVPLTIGNLGFIRAVAEGD